MKVTFVFCKVGEVNVAPVLGLEVHAHDEAEPPVTVPKSPIGVPAQAVVELKLIDGVGLPQLVTVTELDVAVVGTAHAELEVRLQVTVCPAVNVDEV